MLYGAGSYRGSFAPHLVVHAYEVKPSWLVIGLLIFTPFVVWMSTAMTAGFAGFVGLIGMMLVGIYADVTPKAKKPPAMRFVSVTGAPPPQNQQ